MIGAAKARKLCGHHSHENRRCTPGPRHLRRGRTEPRRHPPDPDQPGRHQGHQSSGARQGSIRGRAAHGRKLQHVREPAAQFQRHAHVALRGDPASRARDLGGVLRQPAGRDDRTPRGRHRPHRNVVPLFRDEEGAGVRRRELPGLPRQPHRQARERPDRNVGARGGAGHQPVPLLEEDLRARRAQPALARHHRGEAARAHVDRGAHRDRRERSLLRAVRHPQAPRREIRHRARLRQSEVRRRHGARRGRAAEQRAARGGLRGRVGELRVDPQSFGLRAHRARQGRGPRQALSRRRAHRARVATCVTIRASCALRARQHEK